jgi:formylglycine-generating enzyme required for sulfatase activity
LFEEIETGDGRMSRWVELPIEIGARYPFGDDDARTARHKRSSVVLESGLWMTRTLITESQFAPFRSAFVAPRHYWREQAPRQPAIVGVFEAIAYGRWLEVKAGLGGARLPTQAEWEIACRAGTWWSGAHHPEGLLDVAWLNLPYDTEVVVARKAANPWGLYDMVGLHSEWTLSPHAGGHALQSTPLPPIQSFDPRSEFSVPTVVPTYQYLCGGSLSPDDTPASRHALHPWSSGAFRLVRAPPEPDILLAVT